MNERTTARIGILAALFLVLLTIFASVLAVHVHSDPATSSSCQLCQAAHAATFAVVAAPQLKLMFALSVLVLPVIFQPLARKQLFQLHIRPPPLGLV